MSKPSSLNTVHEHHTHFAVAGEGRNIRFVASDEGVNRYDQIVRTRGWKLDNFRKNPVLLWQHDTDNLPIGRVLIDVINNQLIADAEFATADLNPFADQVFRLAQAGFINAVSVGFIPLAAQDRRDENGVYLGEEVTEQELLELSVVNVGANHDALKVAHRLNFSEHDISRIFPPVVSNQVRSARRVLDVIKLRVSAPTL